MNRHSLGTLLASALRRFGATLAARSPWVAFKIGFWLILLFALYAGAKPFVYDAQAYWNLGDYFYWNGFSLLNWQDPVRGYLLPLINRAVLREVALDLALGDQAVVKAFNALLFALVATMLAPRFARLVWPSHVWSVGRRLTLALALVVFWGGYLNFPLSDFPALAAALAAVVAAGGRPSLLGAAAVGVATAVAVNARPAYVLLVPAVLLLTGWRWWRAPKAPTGMRHGLAGCAALLAGLVIVSLPQSLSAQRHFDTWSPIPGAAFDLGGFQLSTGLKLQRYDTYVGPPGDWPSASMNYIDGSTAKLRSELENGEADGYARYLQLVAENPLTMAGVFARRIVNGFDQRESTPYIEELLRDRRLFRALNFTILFLALLRLLWPAARRSLGPAQWRFAAALLVTCIPAAASAVETRFLLPGYVFAYLLVLAPGWPRMAGLTARARTTRIVAIGAAYVIFMGGAWLVARNTTSQLEPGAITAGATVPVASPTPAPQP